MAGFTNRGKDLILATYFRNAAAPVQFYLALVTAAVAPNADSNLLSELTEIASGNGYTPGGISISRDATGFPTLTEDDSTDLAKVVMKTVNWTASGGTIPASGAAARYAVLTDDNATLGSRQVIAFWDLGGATSVGDTQQITAQNGELRLTE